MTQASLNEIIEQATPQEKRQFKATASVHLNTLRVNMRKQRAEAERKIELGVVPCQYCDSNNCGECPHKNIAG